MNPVVHFEMPYEDRDRMAKFYSNVFGWKANKLGAEMGSYVVVQTTETDSNNMVKKPGTINGGFFKKSPDNTGPSVVVAVDDINDSMKKIESAGGKITGLENGKPLDIPGIGLYVGCIDTEGNRISLLQPKGM